MNFTEQIPKNSTFYKILLVCAFTAAIGVLTVVSSCKSAEKRQAKLYGKFDKLKRKADSDSVLKIVPSKWSLDNFPVTVGKGKTVYIPGRKIPVPVHDTEYVQIDCDSAIKALGIGKGKVRVKPRDSVRVDTIKVTDTIIDNRPLSQLQTDLRQVNDKLIQSKASEQTAKDKLNKRTGIMWWLIAVLVVLLLWTFRKLFGFIR